MGEDCAPGKAKALGMSGAIAFYATNDVYAISVLVFAHLLRQVGTDAPLAMVHRNVSDDVLAALRLPSGLTLSAHQAVEEHHERDRPDEHGRLLVEMGEDKAPPSRTRVCRRASTD
jgi:hypothetical protein